MKRLLTIGLLLITATCFAGDISTISGKAVGDVATISGKAKAAVATVGGGGMPVVGGYTATKVGIVNGMQYAGTNIKIGVYDENRDLITTTAATGLAGSCNVAGCLTLISLNASISIEAAKTYYIAILSDGYPYLWRYTGSTGTKNDATTYPDFEDPLPAGSVFNANPFYAALFDSADTYILGSPGAYTEYATRQAYNPNLAYFATDGYQLP